MQRITYATFFFFFVGWHWENPQFIAEKSDIIEDGVAYVFFVFTAKACPLTTANSRVDSFHSSGFTVPRHKKPVGVRRHVAV